MENIQCNQDEDCCKTRFPIMLVHGTSMSDRRNARCWGRIPDKLTALGSSVCFGRQDAWGSIQNNKIQLAQSVDKALKLFESEKINIIAHSKGGLDARALIAMPAYTKKIASITTISTPHRGIRWLSKIWPWSRIFIAIATVFVYPFFRLFYGDKHPNPYKLAKDMTTRTCDKFNSEIIDAPNVFYQSYAGKMLPESKSKLFHFSRWAANRYDGDNDGMISVETAKWGLFRGIFTGGGKLGLSHSDEIDFFKRNFVGDDALYDDYGTYNDITQIYIGIVKDLKKRGF